jgi:IS5 family transposase
MKQLARTLRRRSGVAMAEVDRLTGEVAGIARSTLRQVQVVAANARRARARRADDGRLGRLVGELAETITATGRLLAQTDQRLSGNRVIPDRLVSLADPDARPIRKGKPRAPTQFGYTLLVAEDERGFIADHQLQRGNPPDAPQLVPAVERVIAVTGRAPGTVVGDRGFGTAANDQALEALGVRRVGLQRTGTPGKARLAVERTRRFRRLPWSVEMADDRPIACDQRKHALAGPQNKQHRRQSPRWDGHSVSRPPARCSPPTHQLARLTLREGGSRVSYSLPAPRSARSGCEAAAYAALERRSHRSQVASRPV